MSAAPRHLLERATAQRKEFCLFRVGKEHYELEYDGGLFRSSGDETAAALAVETIDGLMGGRQQTDLLIGGLGFGAALGRALETPGLRSVTVIESLQCLIGWARLHLGIESALDDGRVELVEGTFDGFVQASSRSYHGVLIDVDRGPVHTLMESNRRSYSLSMLEALARRLRSGGVVAVTLDEEDEAYRRALGQTFLEVGSRPVPGEGSAFIYFGRT